jgi:hypothetical protein
MNTEISKLIPRGTDLELIKEFIFYIVTNDKPELSLKEHKENIRNIFKSVKKSLDVNDSLLTRSINKTYQLLLATGVIENNDGVLLFSKKLDLINLESSVKQLIKDNIIGQINSSVNDTSLSLDPSGELSKKQLKDIISNIQSYNSKRTINSNANMLFNLLSELNDIDLTIHKKTRNHLEPIDDSFYELKNLLDTSGISPDIINNSDLTKFCDTMGGEERLENIIKGNNNTKIDYLSAITHGNEAYKLFENSILNNKKIVVVTDSDSDGISFVLMIKSFLVIYPEFSDNVSIVISDTSGSDVNHGINLHQLKKLGFNENNTDVIITSDNGINSNIQDIIDFFKLYAFILTDHHISDNKNTIAENLDGEGCKVVIFNPEYNTPKDNLLNSSICGAHTTGLLLIEFLKKHPNSRSSELINRIENIFPVANHLDMVHTIYNYTPNQLSNISSIGPILNSLNSMRPFWNRFSSTEITNKDMKDIFMADDDYSKFLSTSGNKLRKTGSKLYHIHHNILQGSFYSNDQEIKQALLDAFDPDIEPISYEPLPNLRIAYLDMFSGKHLRHNDIIFLPVIENFMKSIREFEKLTHKFLIKNKDQILTEIKDDKHVLFRIFDHPHKNTPSGRKYYNKLIPYSSPSINGFVITIDGVYIHGSNGSNGSVVVGSFRSNTFSKDEIFSDQVLSEIKIKYGCSILTPGHSKAAGITFTFDEKLTTQELHTRLKKISIIINNSIESLSSVLKEKYIETTDINMLPDLLKFYNLLRISSSPNNYSPVHYINPNQLTFSTDLNVFINNSNISESTDTIPKSQLNFISEKIKEGNWLVSPLSVSGDSILIRTSDIKEVKKLQDENKLCVYVLKYMGPGIFIVDGVQETKFITRHISKKNNFMEKQHEYFLENFTIENNFILDISDEDVMTWNPLLNGSDKKAFNNFKQFVFSIVDKIDSSITKVTSLDVEANGLGKAPALTNFGMFIANINGSEITFSMQYILLKDYGNPTSFAIDNLTGLPSDFRNKHGIDISTADKLLHDLYKDEKILFWAHNLLYDYGVVGSNLSLFFDILNKSLLGDTAKIAREFKLAVSPTDLVSTVKFIGNGDSIHTIKGLSTSETDKFNLFKFLSNLTENSSFTNNNNNITLKFISINDTLKLVYSDVEKYSDVIISDADSIEYNIVSTASDKKYSISEMLKMHLAKKIAFEISPLPSDQIDIDYLSSSILPLSDIIKNKFIFNNDFNISDNISFFIQSNLNDIYKEIIDLPEISDKILNMKNTKTPKEDKINALVKKYLKSDIIPTLTKILNEEIETVSIHDIKKILNIYKPDSKNPSFNLTEIRKSTNFDNSTIDIILESIDNLLLDKSIENKELLDFYNSGNFLDLFNEKHNNIDRFSDVMIEFFIIRDSLNGTDNEISSIFLKNIFDTIAMTFFDYYKSYLGSNTDSFSTLQMIDNKSNGVSTKKTERIIDDYYKNKLNNSIRLSLDDDNNYLVLNLHKKSDYNSDTIKNIKKIALELSTLVKIYNKNSIPNSKIKELEDVLSKYGNFTVVMNFTKPVKELFSTVSDALFLLSENKPIDDFLKKLETKVLKNKKNILLSDWSTIHSNLLSMVRHLNNNFNFPGNSIAKVIDFINNSSNNFNITDYPDQFPNNFNNYLRKIAGDIYNQQITDLNTNLLIDYTCNEIKDPKDVIIDIDIE